MSKDEAVREAMLSSPPVTILGMSLAGISLQDWVCIATLGWLALQSGWFVYSKYKLLKKDQKDGEE